MGATLIATPVFSCFGRKLSVSFLIDLCLFLEDLHVILAAMSKAQCRAPREKPVNEQVWCAQQRPCPVLMHSVSLLGLPSSDLRRCWCEERSQECIDQHICPKVLTKHWLQWGVKLCPKGRGHGMEWNDTAKQSLCSVKAAWWIREL